MRTPSGARTWLTSANLLRPARTNVTVLPQSSLTKPLRIQLLQQFLVMGKKKGSNKSNAVSVETIPRGSDDASAQQLSAGGEEPQASAKEQSNNNNQLEQMEVAELKAELLAARAELAKLRSQVQESGGAGKLLGKPQEVQELQSKLQQLRKEQQEADSARDKAWMQLKAVVKEISDLASPDYLQSLVVSKAQAAD